MQTALPTHIGSTSTKAAILLSLGLVEISADEVPLVWHPRRPAVGKYYPTQALLNCQGANFSNVWDIFFPHAIANAQAGFPEDPQLYERAAQIYHQEQSGLVAASFKYPQVLVRQMAVTRLEGFCLYGYMTTLFILYRHTLNPEHIQDIESYMGWREWPLDFSESSRWPTLWRIVPLHLENWRRLGSTHMSKELSQWGDDEWLLPRPNLFEVEHALYTWLHATGAMIHRWGDGFKASGRRVVRSLKEVLLKSNVLRVVVLGHHLGSSLEPFTMFREALRVGVQLDVHAFFAGQRHPKPGLVCKEFGYCDTNLDLDSWFKTYESRWLGEYEWMATGWDLALSKLANIVGSSAVLMASDVIICGGPAWFCSMLRSIRPSPMLMYFAWPIAPMVPADIKTHVFAQIKLLGQTLAPPTVLIVANWALAAQFAVQLSMYVPVQRPQGIYVNQTYSPIPALDGRPKVMVTRVGHWAGQSGIALLETTWGFMEQEHRETGKKFPLDIVFLSIRIRGTNTNRALTYGEFAKFYACVFWPWDVMMLLFNELYTLTMPLLVPARRWMHQLMFHALVHTDVNWWHLRNNTVAGQLPRASNKEFPLPYLPWAGRDSTLAELAYWYELTDFMQVPHITYFDSIPDMLRKLRVLDVETIRKGMHRFNTVSLRESLGFYRAVAVELLS